MSSKITIQKALDILKEQGIHFDKQNGLYNGCPVHKDTIVELKDGKIGRAGDFYWGYSGGLDKEGNIYKYRIVEEIPITADKQIVKKGDIVWANSHTCQVPFSRKILRVESPSKVFYTQPDDEGYIGAKLSICYKCPREAMKAKLRGK